MQEEREEREKPARRVVIVGAGARGNRVFADLIDRHRTGFVNAGVVEPDEARREAFRRRYGIADDRVFPSVREFLAAPRFGDVVFICTPDPTHYTLCRDVSEKGYDILLEKPIATTLADCLALLDVEQTHRNRIFVAHVLRYSPFFRKVREIVRSGELGAIRNVRLSENVGHWHYAHSYVRGNWRRREDSAPIVLTKSSHDLDILHWLLDEPVEAVSSVGSLSYFRPEHAPEGAAERCVDCRYRESCLYSAPRFYLRDRVGWPYDVPATPDTPENRERAIREGPYGRCVWHCDNDVCDNQTVLLRLASGIHATFELMAHTADNTRTLAIRFDTAELWGDLRRGRLRIAHFQGLAEPPEVEEVPLPVGGDSHGGGDLELLHALHDHLTTGGHDEIVTSLRSSLPSHVLAFLADESRLQGGVPLPVPDIFAPRDPHPAAEALT